MSQPTDRNLLVGILALQMDFITSRQLVTAMNAWVLQKHRPLEEILREHRALSSDTFCLLQGLVEKRLEMHGQNVEHSLQTISSVKEVFAPLWSVADGDVQATLHKVKTAGVKLESLKDNQATEIDNLCDQFIRAWRTGRKPRIEDYLSRVSRSSSDRLLEELLKEELFLRMAAGDALPSADYRLRFPGQTSVVERAFAFHEGQTGRHDAESPPLERRAIQAGAEPPRFQAIRPHAKGGLGEVFVARDTELNREVALKEIQSRYADDSSSRSRFLVEAEITGRLEHPGIVPVYGLGQYADGRPYYAMRFIRGDSLKDAIEQFHHRHARTGDLSIGEAGVEFRRLLGRFVDVCEALEYAHSRGVLHRDVKPSNIMLGKYGETLVVDWGLAKMVGRAEHCNQGDEPTLTPGSESPTSWTEAGSALGTPVFMSPEQAAGRVDELGPATDIYSLGATLYQLLTGRPPFVGRSADEILRRVQAGEFPSPSDVVKTTGAINDDGELSESQRRLAVPKPLEAICLKAMSREVAKRYPSAASLAAEIENYLADEPVQALGETAADRLRRWGRKNPRTVGSLAAGLLVTTMSLGMVAALVSRNNAVLAGVNGRIQLQSRQITQKNSDLRRANAAERLATIEAQTKQQLAEAAEARAKLAQAQAERLEALARASELNALQRSAEVAARRGDWEQSLEFIERAINLTTDDDQRVRLEIEKAKGEWVLSRSLAARKTLEALRQHVAERPVRNRILLWSALIDSRLETGQVQRWLEELNSAEQANSLESGERSLVRALLAPQSDETVLHLRELLDEEPFFPGAQHLLIFAHLVRGERALARREIEIARRLHPSDPNTAVAEAMLLALEAPTEEVERRLPALLANMPESVRPVVNKLVTLLSQLRESLRHPSSSSLVTVTLLQEIRTVTLILRLGKDLGEDSLLLGPSIFLGKRWFRAVSQSSVEWMINPEKLVTEMLNVDPMGDLLLLRGLLRRNRHANAEAASDLWSAATGGRLLLPLESEVAALLVDTQLGMVIQEKRSLETIKDADRQRMIASLALLRHAIALRGPPLGQNLENWIEMVVPVCRVLRETALGEDFLDLWDKQHLPTTRTLKLRGDLLRFATIPEFFRALDCYQQALDANPGTEAERLELEERVRETMEEIQCQAEEMRWHASEDKALR